MILFSKVTGQLKNFSQIVEKLKNRLKILENKLKKKFSKFFSTRSEFVLIFLAISFLSTKLKLKYSYNKSPSRTFFCGLHNSFLFPRQIRYDFGFRPA